MEKPENSPNLQRFLDAQEGAYSQALEEIQAGRKRSHWIWYIFPQLAGLGVSPTAKYYAIRDLREARDYLAHPVLRGRLLEVSEALLSLKESDPSRVMGFPDDLKLRSSMTLFLAAEPGNDTFKRVLEKFYGGEPDGRTLALLRGKENSF